MRPCAPPWLRRPCHHDRNTTPPPSPSVAVAASKPVEPSAAVRAERLQALQAMREAALARAEEAEKEAAAPALERDAAAERPVLPT